MDFTTYEPRISALEAGGGGGGGDSDFSTANVTLKASNAALVGVFISGLPMLESDGLITECEVNIEANEQVEKTIALYKGKTSIATFGLAVTVKDMTGNIIDDGTVYIITGDCSITLAPMD